MDAVICCVTIMFMIAALSAAAVMGLPLLQFKQCPALLGFVDGLTLYGLIKIYQMAVELRAVHTGEFDFAADA